MINPFKPRPARVPQEAQRQPTVEVVHSTTVIVRGIGGYLEAKIGKRGGIRIITQRIGGFTADPVISPENLEKFTVAICHAARTARRERDGGHARTEDKRDPGGRTDRTTGASIPKQRRSQRRDRRC